MLLSKEKIKKITIIILFFIILITPIISQASVSDDLGDLGSYGQVVGSYDRFKTKVSNFLGAIQVVGSFCSVICLVILGIKYMMGSIEAKAEYKKTLLPYFIGSMMIFGISNLLKFVYDVAINIF